MNLWQALQTSSLEWRAKRTRVVSLGSRPGGWMFRFSGGAGSVWHSSRERTNTPRRTGDDSLEWACMPSTLPSSNSPPRVPACGVVRPGMRVAVAPPPASP